MVKEEREKVLRALVEEKLPEWTKLCQNGDAEGALMHQDAFAADFQIEELTLLGAAIKYAGLYKKEVRIAA